VIGYFVIYPWLKAKRGFTKGLHDTKLMPSRPKDINLTQIKSAGGIFSDTFLFLRAHFSSLIWVVLGLTGLYSVFIFLAAQAPADEVFNTQAEVFNTLSSLGLYFVNDNIPFLYWLNTLFFAVLAFYVFRLFIKKANNAEEQKKETIRSTVLSFLKILFISACFHGILQTNGWFTIFLIFGASLYLYIWMFVSKKEGKNLWAAFLRSTDLVSVGFGRVILLLLILLLMSILFYLVLDTGVVFILLSFIGMNFSFGDEILKLVGAIMQTFATLFVTNMIFAMQIVAFSLLYYTLLEIKEAPYLKEKLNSIGLHKSIRGLARES